MKNASNEEKLAALEILVNDGNSFDAVKRASLLSTIMNVDLSHYIQNDKNKDIIAKAKNVEINYVFLINSENITKRGRQDLFANILNGKNLEMKIDFKKEKSVDHNHIKVI